MENFFIPTEHDLSLLSQAFYHQFMKDLWIMVFQVGGSDSKGPVGHRRGIVGADSY